MQSIKLNYMKMLIFNFFNTKLNFHVVQSDILIFIVPLERPPAVVKSTLYLEPEA